jgi:hypothetical protein
VNIAAVSKIPKVLLSSQTFRPMCGPQHPPPLPQAPQHEVAGRFPLPFWYRQRKEILNVQKAYFQIVLNIFLISV